MTSIKIYMCIIVKSIVHIYVRDIIFSVKKLYIT